MSVFKRVEDITDRTVRWISIISLVGLLILASATVIDVFLRWVFNRPIVGLADTHSLFIAVIIAACFPICVFKKGNISIRFLGNFLGPRARNFLDAMGYLMMLVVYGFMGWTLWRYTNELAEDGSTTWALGWPVSPWWRIVTIIVLLCIPVTAVAVVQYVRVMKRGGHIALSETSTKIESIGEGE